jgi:hypothetical protein
MNAFGWSFWPLRSRLRYFCTETLPWWVAFHLPRKVALFAFIRVYGVLGICGPEFEAAYAEWERRGTKAAE